MIFSSHPGARTLLLLAASLFAPFFLPAAVGPVLRQYTVAGLPTASSMNGQTVMVTDGATLSDCTTGGGTIDVHCQSNGTSWLPQLMGGQAATAPTHQFQTGMSTTGTATFAQPDFSDLVGTATASQLPTPTTSTLGGVEAYTAVANQFLTSISTAGAPVSAQPAFSNLSGSATVAQLPAFARPIYLAAAGCAASTAFSAFDLPASAAPTPNCYGTSYTFGALDYADAAASTATFHFTLPAGFNSLDADLLWSVGSATQTAKWTVSTVCLAAASDVLNPTFNTAQTITSASGATSNTLTIASQTSVTTTGCSGGNEMIMKVGRDVTDASTATISLRGVRLTPHVTPQT